MMDQRESEAVAAIVDWVRAYAATSPDHAVRALATSDDTVTLLNFARFKLEDRKR